MKHKRMGDRILARLFPGEEIIESLKALTREARIPAGSLAGLGAVNDVTLALYETASRSYRTTRLEEELEVVSLTGNLSWLGGDPVVHAHGVVSRADCSTVAGHIMRGIVSITLEVMVEVYSERVERKPEPEIGLNLLDLA